MGERYYLMAKRRYGIDEAKINRFYKEGRGQGVGIEYKPWLTIQDVSSRGLSSRIHGRTTGREHHLLSKLEADAFFIYDWDDSVIDIREQFPLNRDLTRKIANEMGVKHPYDNKGKVDIVMTTDFIVDIRNKDGEKQIARSVKQEEDLNNARTLEKQEIERRYWLEPSNDWGIITGSELPSIRIKNLRWLHEMISFAHLEVPYTGYWEEKCYIFLNLLSGISNITIREFIQILEDKHGFPSGGGLNVLRHLASNKVIEIDLDSSFSTKKPVLDTLIINQMRTEEFVRSA